MAIQLCGCLLISLFFNFFKTAAKSFGRNSDRTGFEEEISAGSVVAVVVAQSQFFSFEEVVVVNMQVKYNTPCGLSK